MEEKKIFVGTIRKARKNRKYCHKSAKRFGRIIHLPNEWIGKKCLVVLITEYEAIATYGKIRALKLVEEILLRK